MTRMDVVLTEYQDMPESLRRRTTGQNSVRCVLLPPEATKYATERMDMYRSLNHPALILFLIKPAHGLGFELNQYSWSGIRYAATSLEID